MAVMNASRLGYEVYFVVDCCAGETIEAHNIAVQRLIQAGAVPVHEVIEVRVIWRRRLLEANSFRGDSM